MIEDHCYEYQQWRYMNCDSKEVYFKEELWDCYECEYIEEFEHSLIEYYKWMSKEDKKLFIDMFKKYKASEE